MAHNALGEVPRERRAVGPLRQPDQDFELKLLDLFERHGRMEGAILDSYRQVAERSSAGAAVQYLVRLILEDEHRHHQVFAEMANQIRSVVWEVPVEPTLPVMKRSSDPDLLAETKRLLEFEEQDAKELRALRRTLRKSPTSSLNPLMVQLMLLDTTKHIAILKHIKAHLGR